MYSKLIKSGEGIFLPYTDGSERIVDALDIFNVDPDFRSLPTGDMDPTPELEVDIHRILGGNSVDILSAISDNLYDLCLPEDKIISFVRIHPSLLRGEGGVTLFPFKVRINEQLRIKIAYLMQYPDGKPWMRFADFLAPHSWGEKCFHRLIVPKEPLSY